MDELKKRILKEVNEIEETEEEENGIYINLYDRLKKYYKNVKIHALRSDEKSGIIEIEKIKYYYYILNNKIEIKRI